MPSSKIDTARGALRIKKKGWETIISLRLKTKKTAAKKLKGAYLITGTVPLTALASDCVVVACELLFYVI